MAPKRLPRILCNTAVAMVVRWQPTTTVAVKLDGRNKLTTLFVTQLFEIGYYWLFC